MKSIFASPVLFVILAALLLCAFFLPDLLGPVAGTALSAVIVLVALLIYNRWCRYDDSTTAKDREDPKPKPPI